MTNLDAFKTGLAVLSGAFNREMAPEAVRAYWIALQGLTEAEWNTATRRALAECRFMPVPAELIALAGRARNLPAEIAEAWEAVRTAVYRLDYTESVDFGPRVNAVVRNIGGWLRLCELGKQELDVWARKEFERVYEALADKPTDSLHGQPHLGEFKKAPTWIQIGSTPRPPRQLEDATVKGVGALVRGLANSKDLDAK